MALEHVEKRAKRIRERRIELGMTQEELAERMQEIHIKRRPESLPDKTRGQMVSDWERAVNDPRGYKLELLAEALEWEVADLEADNPRHKNGTHPDLMDALSAAPSVSGLAAAVDDLTKQVAALKAELRAGLGKVQKAQEDQQKLLERVARSRATGSK